MTASPAQIAAAWRAFRSDRTGALLGPGPAFVEAIDAALVVGDAERAAGSAEAWRAYEEARGAYTTACNRMGGAEQPDLGAAWDGQQAARSALDAAVRRLAGMV